MSTLRDEFLSEEDLDLRNLSDEELFAYWNRWLEQAQATNDMDEPLYSHGVFTVDPTFRRNLRNVAEERTTYGDAVPSSPSSPTR
jgi:hypothetical protein